MIKILDTNIILLDANNILNLIEKENIIVLPEVVIDEIDPKKTGLNEISFQAREFTRLMNSAEDVIDIEYWRNLIILKKEIKGKKIYVVSLKTYPKYKDIEKNIINDRKIIEVAVQFNKYARKKLKQDTVFISNDNMCKLRAESLGLNSISLKEVNKTSFDFNKKLKVDLETFEKLNHLFIVDIDKDYLPENYNYHFYTSDGRESFGIIVNNKIELFNEKSTYMNQDIPPINFEQKLFTQAIQSYKEIIISDSKAGSGKNVIAISNAIDLVKQKLFEKIIYIRSSQNDVDPSEEIGFLPGDLSEKTNGYLMPLIDTLDFIARKKLSKKIFSNKKEQEDSVENEIKNMKEKYNITAITTLGLRGRTLQNAVIIIDEAQNLSKSQLLKILSRIGKNSKIIIIGSNTQIDNIYLNKYTNGLSTILEACVKPKKYDGIPVTLHAVKMNRIVRGPITEFAEKIFS